jgi:GNAT superfamily N-acetyltransferase
MKVIEESRSRGRLASAQGSAIGWALSAAPPVPSVPAGFNLRIEEGEWMRSEMVSGRWPNGLGYGPTGGIGGRAARNRFAAVIFDAVGAPVAVGGVMDTWGLLEVGVDVLEEYQGRGLGALVVQAATRAILDRGGVPLYGCAFDNIRSQRTALASGYLPTYAEAYVAG